MDTETKQLIQELKGKLDEQDNIKGAVQQLEQELQGLPRTIENKLKAIRRTAWGPDGNYRGIFDSEEDARGFGLFCMAALGDRRAEAAMKSEFKDMHQRVMGDTPESGPGLVPVEFSTRIQRLVEEAGVFAADAFTMPMTGNSLTFNRRKSGVKVFKSKSPSKSDASDPEWEHVNLNAEDWHALVLYPKSLGDDAATAVGELIAMEIVQGFAEAIDDHGFAGDGTPDSLDVLGITKRLVDINGTDDGGGLVLGTGSAGAKWGSLVRDDFLKMMGRARYVRNGRFYCSNEFYWTIMAPIILGAGGTTAAEMEGARRIQAFGAPVRITPSMPRTAGDSQVACLFGQLDRSSTIGRSQQLQIEQSREALFIERQVAVLGTQRMDINNHSLGDATTAGPMVGLITPAAA